MITVWLPSPKRLQRIGVWPELASLLARGDRLADAAEGLPALVAQSFALTPNRLSEAALSRLADCGDAAHGNWLRADPVSLGADQSSLRLMAFNGLNLDHAAAEDLAAVLKPLFGDIGYELSVVTPERWYLRLADGSEIPEFSPPERVLGDRLDAHLPTGTSGLRWQRLLTEAQMSLHAHRLNQRRMQHGQMPINSLWFWGGGRLPNRVQTTVARVHSADPVLQGLSRHAARAFHADLAEALQAPRTAHDLFDLRAAFADPGLRATLLSALQSWLQSNVPVQIAFESGERLLVKPWHRIRFWRKPLDWT
ncbi:phosphoglycerate mutase [Ahniella affigens]|uniref:Phosphoglycerate mutase n=1 Tax=Ahniella affigens TaxID=2021234 RepID=A0A2P1PU58_9GAMM|nr:phosphoglycerate mutase [Ahniella affigens]AVP98375.1 phosphoglycerate mutase [Ahniella affigens]